MRGRTLPASDQRVLATFATHVAVALEQDRLARAAAEVRPIIEADRMRTALLAAVSHDLRTPLASIKAAVTSLRSPDVEFGPEDTAELLETAEESVDRLTRLVENLLDMSRLQAGALSVNAEPLTMDEVLPLALDGLGIEPGRVVLGDTEGAPPVRADPVLLERIVANLVANAARHSPPDHPVVLTASGLGGRVELRVIDRGPGIPREDRERVFQPFQRLGDNDNAAGVGLGLALARGLTEAMGGTLIPEDTPGGGLTMVVNLPAAGSSDAVSGGPGERPDAEDADLPVRPTPGELERVRGLRTGLPSS
jgi:two-component system sensor histidine kinase KdpD